MLSHDASYEGSFFGNLVLHAPLPPDASIKDESRDFLRRRGRNIPKAKRLWEDKHDRRFTSFIVSPELLLATGHPDKKPNSAFLAAIRIKDGTDAWRHALPADAVKGGTAIGADGRLFVALENGQLWCFADQTN